ncbi:MAG: CapA family protein, partial [Gammaproteobacteria bacterium]
LNVINLEFMLPGSSGKDLDRQIDRVAIDVLKRTGYDVISRANNHAMDFGRDGVGYNTRLLQQAEFKMMGTREFSGFTWKIGGYEIAIFSLTDSTDKPDPDRLILKIDASDLQIMRKAFSNADFRIAFVHLGSISFYRSPHERKQVKRIIDSGADLVVCTGTHFIKGFVYEDGKPVIYGIGDHPLFLVDNDTEPVGMHFVAGFKKRKLVQLFVIPFHNITVQGRSAPLNEAAVASFKDVLTDRSSADLSRYYSDPQALAGFKEELRQLNFSKLKDLRARHFLYATGILFHNHPVMATTMGLVLFIVALMITHRVIFRRMKRRI